MSAIMFLRDHYKISIPMKRKEQAVRFFFFLVLVLVKLEGFRYSLEDSHGCHRVSGSGGIVFLCHHWILLRLVFWSGFGTTLITSQRKSTWSNVSFSSFCNDFIGISAGKVDQSIKDLILELLEEGDELVPIGSLEAFDSTKKSFGYF